MPSEKVPLAQSQNKSPANPSRKRASRNVFGDASNFENTPLHNDSSPTNGKRSKKNSQHCLDQNKDAENQAGLQQQPKEKQTTCAVEVSPAIKNKPEPVQKSMKDYLTISERVPLVSKNPKKEMRQTAITDYMKRDDYEENSSDNEECVDELSTHDVIPTANSLDTKEPLQDKTAGNEDCVDEKYDSPKNDCVGGYEMVSQEERSTGSNAQKKEEPCEEFHVHISTDAGEWNSSGKSSLLLCNGKSGFDKQKAEQTAVECKRKSSSRSTYEDDGSHLMKIQDLLQSPLINEKDICQLDVTGEGQFGVVRKALWKGSQVAVKITVKNDNESSNMAEVLLLDRLRHPNVVMLLGYCITDTSVLLVTNYIKGKNLSEALGLRKSKPVGKTLEPTYNGYVLFTTAQGVLYLHQKGIIHQDLKPANIMVEEGSHKGIVCDLGLGKLKDNVTMLTREGTNAGTLAYQHIEQLEGKPPSTSVDVYAFAVIALEVYSRVSAWRGISSHEIESKIKNGDYPVMPNIPEDAKALIASCFKAASKRPSIDQLMPLLENMVDEKVGIW